MRDRHRLVLVGYALLRMAEKPMHGWELIGLLRDASVEADASVVYRTLRSMEGDELVRSTWEDSPTGPRRRVYVITDRGRESLRVLVDEVRDARTMLDRFLEAASPRELGRVG